MTFHDGKPSRAADTYNGALIVRVYRCAMAGFSLGETECWELGWRALGEVVPSGEAGALFGQFYGFVRALLAVARTPLAWRPESCRGLCDHEALALRMIEASQRGDTVRLLETAATLLDVEELGDVLQATQSLAAALARHGLMLRAPGGSGACAFDLCPRRRLH